LQSQPDSSQLVQIQPPLLFVRLARTRARYQDWNVDGSSLFL